MSRPNFCKNNSQSAPAKSAVPIIIIKTSWFDRKYFQNGFRNYLQAMQSRNLLILSVKSKRQSLKNYEDHKFGNLIPNYILKNGHNSVQKKFKNPGIPYPD